MAQFVDLLLHSPDVLLVCPLFRLHKSDFFLEIANLTDRALRVFLVIVQLVLELFVLLLLGLGELLHIVCPV